jgi:hypothetical protein
MVMSPDEWLSFIQSVHTLTKENVIQWEQVDAKAAKSPAPPSSVAYVAKLDLMVGFNKTGDYFEANKERASIAVGPNALRTTVKLLLELADKQAKQALDDRIAEAKNNLKRLPPQ